MESPAARVGALSRNPAGIQAVRRLRDELGIEVQMVLLDSVRAIVVAAFSDLTLQPRPLTAAERLLVNGQDHHSATTATATSFAVRVLTEGADLVALSVGVGLTAAQVAEVSAAAEALSTSLLEPGPATGSRCLNDDRDPAEILATQRDVALVIDSNFVVQYCNQAVVTTFGWTPDELVGRVATELIHPDDLGAAIGGISRLQNAEEIYRVHLRFLNASGDWSPVSVTAIDQNHNPKVRGITVSMRPADYERETTRSLKVLEARASTDQLTGLSNRQALRNGLSALSSRWTHVIVPAGPIAACFVGIDQFKAINDVHGHGIGDHALRMAAARLRSCAAEGDLVARIGGDEFVLIVVDPERSASVDRVAQHVRALLSEPYEVAGNRLHLTVSIGVAVHEHGDFTADVLLQNGDIALAAAKERGRDQIVEFDSELAVAGAKAQTQRNMVRTAINRGGLQMHYQPIVRTDGTIVGFEALARCFDSAGNLHMPNDFIPAITETSLLVQLDREGFRQSCELAASLQNDWPDANLFVSANCSTKSLSQSDFVENILTTVLRTGATPSTLCVEITESSAFEAGQLSIDALDKLRDAGVQIALDDFGTGYSSLSHLRDLPFSSVKIDRSFVEALPVSGPEQTITRAMTELARALGFTITAEGVETRAQLEAASLMGIEQMQGWHFDKALTLEEAHERVAAQFGRPPKSHVDLHLTADQARSEPAET